jgi:hypothetical protein
MNLRKFQIQKINKQNLNSNKELQISKMLKIKKFKNKKFKFEICSL